MAMAVSLNQQILEDAAAWYFDLRQAEYSDDIVEHHRRWLQEHPDHRRAWDRIETLNQSVLAIPSGVGTTLLEARASRRQSIKALSLLLFGGGAGALAINNKQALLGRVADLTTVVGERRSEVLADGTQLILNTDTAIDVDYSQELRKLVVHHGEVLVTTATDPQARPFIVHTAFGTAKALGTRFSVMSTDEASRVQVFEHAVEVSPARGRGSKERVDAGQQLHFSREQTGLLQVLPANSDAWVNGLLVADNWLLKDFLYELSRYRRGYLGCDVKAAKLRISGAFHLNNIDAVLHNLANTLPVHARRISPWWVRLEAL